MDVMVELMRWRSPLAPIAGWVHFHALGVVVTG